MFYKLFGSFTIVFSCAAFGYTIKHKHLIRIKELENMLMCIDILEKEFNVFLSTVDDAFSLIDTYSSKYNKNIFNKAVKLHKNSNGEPFLNIWITVLDSIDDKIYKKEDIEILKKFGNLLGVGDTQVQNNNINTLKISLNDIIAKAKKEYEKISLSTKIGIYIGIILSVFLI